MKKFKVLSNRLAGKKAGEVIDANDLGGANIEALLQSGHIEVLKESKKSDEAVKEAIEANQYEFKEDGTRF